MKKHNIRRTKLKKLYEVNSWWNDWKFHLHWHKLEWFNPRIKIKSKNPIQFLQFFHIYKGDRTSHWVVHSALK